MIPVYNFTQSKHTTFRANTNSSIPIQASDSSMLFTRFIQFKEGDRSVVHSNSIYGHLVCKQRFTGVSSVCSIGSSKPITTAVPSTYMTCQNKSKYVSLCLFKTFFFFLKKESDPWRSFYYLFLFLNEMRYEISTQKAQLKSCSPANLFTILSTIWSWSQSSFWFQIYPFTRKINNFEKASLKYKYFVCHYSSTI